MPRVLVSDSLSDEGLAILERAYQNAQAKRLLEAGVTLADLWRVDVRGTLECGRDVHIDVNCVFEGAVRLGDGVRVGPNCVLRNVAVGARTEIHAFSQLEDAEIGQRCRVGPYARLRPGARLGEDVHIGNFVEVKASRIGAGSKANHLSYIGDAEVGARVNVGAGTITCNYDGFKKHRTVIGARVQIGSDTQLVAPVTVADDVYVASGTTVRHDVAPGSLVFNSRQEVHRAGWVESFRQRDSRAKAAAPKAQGAARSVKKARRAKAAAKTVRGRPRAARRRPRS